MLFSITVRISICHWTHSRAKQPKLSQLFFAILGHFWSFFDLKLSLSGSLFCGAVLRLLKTHLTCHASTESNTEVSLPRNNCTHHVWNSCFTRGIRLYRCAICIWKRRSVQTSPRHTSSNKLGSDGIQEEH